MAKYIHKSSNSTVRGKVFINRNLTKAEAEAEVAYCVRVQWRQMTVQHTPHLTSRKAENGVWSCRQRLTIPPVGRVDKPDFSTNSGNKCIRRLVGGQCVPAYWREAYSTIGLTFHQIINDSYRVPRLLLTNIRSLRYKTDELEAEILNNNIDICCITESWLTDAISTEWININGYVCYRRDRTDGRQAGGVVCYVRQDLPFTLLKPVNISGVESLWQIVQRATRKSTILNKIYTDIGEWYVEPSI